MITLRINALIANLLDLRLTFSVCLVAEDAEQAIQHGVGGVIVSNHGGRQLDTVPATVS